MKERLFLYLSAQHAGALQVGLRESFHVNIGADGDNRLPAKTCPVGWTLDNHNGDLCKAPADYDGGPGRCAKTVTGLSKKPICTADDATDPCDFKGSVYAWSKSCGAPFEASILADCKQKCDESRKCTCENGKGNVGEKCSKDKAASCASCDTGFHLDEIKKTCEPNTCTCKDGKQSENEACTEHESESCASCDKGFHLDKTNNLCEANKCTCENGKENEGADCTEDQDPSCASCDKGFIMNKEKTACLKKKKCKCENGTAHTGDDCPKNNATSCSECDDGHTLDEKTKACIKNLEYEILTVTPSATTAQPWWVAGIEIFNTPDCTGTISDAHELENHAHKMTNGYYPKVNWKALGEYDENNEESFKRMVAKDFPDWDTSTWDVFRSECYECEPNAEDSTLIMHNVPAPNHPNGIKCIKIHQFNGFTVPKVDITWNGKPLPKEVNIKYEAEGMPLKIAITSDIDTPWAVESLIAYKTEDCSGEASHDFDGRAMEGFGDYPPETTGYHPDVGDHECHWTYIAEGAGYESACEKCKASETYLMTNVRSDTKCIKVDQVLGMDSRTLKLSTWGDDITKTSDSDIHLDLQFLGEQLVFISLESPTEANWQVNKILASPHEDCSADGSTFPVFTSNGDGEEHFEGELTGETPFRSNCKTCKTQPDGGPDLMATIPLDTKCIEITQAAGHSQKLSVQMEIGARPDLVTLTNSSTPIRFKSRLDGYEFKLTIDQDLMNNWHDWQISRFESFPTEDCSGEATYPVVKSGSWDKEIKDTTWKSNNGHANHVDNTLIGALASDTKCVKVTQVAGAQSDAMKMTVATGDKTNLTASDAGLALKTAMDGTYLEITIDKEMQHAWRVSTVAAYGEADCSGDVVAYPKLSDGDHRFNGVLNNGTTYESACETCARDQPKLTGVITKEVKCIKIIQNENYAAEALTITAVTGDSAAPRILNSKAEIASNKLRNPKFKTMVYEKDILLAPTTTTTTTTLMYVPPRSSVGPINTSYTRSGCYQFRTNMNEYGEVNPALRINKNDYGQEVLPGSMRKFYDQGLADKMTTEICFAFCRNYMKTNPSYRFFALYKELDFNSPKINRAYKDKCVCLNMPPATNVSENLCGQPCNANSNQNCGGVCRSRKDSDKFCNMNQNEREQQTFAGVWSIYQCPNKTQAAGLENIARIEENNLVNTTFRKYEATKCAAADKPISMKTKSGMSKSIFADFEYAFKCKQACYDSPMCAGFTINEDSLECHFFDACNRTELSSKEQKIMTSTYWQKMYAAEREAYRASQQSPKKTLFQKFFDMVRSIF